jgi:hypothetical protein
VGVCALDADVYSATAGVSARGRLTRFYGMLGAAKPRGHAHRLAVERTQRLQLCHECGLHLVLAAVGAVELSGLKVGS